MVARFRLKVVDLAFNPRVGGGLRAVGALDSLVKLYLGRCAAVEGELRALEGLVRMKRLELSKTGVSGDVGALARQQV